MLLVGAISAWHSQHLWHELIHHFEVLKTGKSHNSISGLEKGSYSENDITARGSRREQGTFVSMAIRAPSPDTSTKAIC